MAKHTVDNPFTGETAVSIDQASEAEIGKILDGAQETAKALRKKTVEERIAICEQALVKMEGNAETIAQDITKQMGKPLSQARGEVKGMAGRWRHMSAIAREALADIVLPAKDGFDRRIAKDPLGVVLDLPAWNYPLLTAVNAVVPAILAVRTSSTLMPSLCSVTAAIARLLRVATAVRQPRRCITANSSATPGSSVARSAPASSWRCRISWQRAIRSGG
jgi:acyl-CoA reductase-like NAD-dependent aldehyde dehydrogenase